MKQNDGGFAPSYNLQLGSDAAQDIIVSVQVVPACNDQNQLGPVRDEIQRQGHQPPKEAVVDEGYLNRATVVDMDKRGVNLIAGGDLEENRDPEKAARNCAGRGVARSSIPNNLSMMPNTISTCVRRARACPSGREARSRRGGTSLLSGHGQRLPHLSHQPQCCPTQGQPTPGRTIVRSQNEPVVAAFVEKMKTRRRKPFTVSASGLPSFPTCGSRKS